MPACRNGQVFVRDEYFMALVGSLAWCRKEKGMEIYSWCIMPSHVHLVFRAKDANPGELLKSFKTYTSKSLQKMITDHPQESRRECLPVAGGDFVVQTRAGLKNSNVKNMQFWQQHNKPIELWSPEVIDQKVDYIHNNPVIAGFVTEAHYWKYSSAIDYSGGKGMLEIDFV